MRFVSRDNFVILEENSYKIILNTTEFSISKIYVFEDGNIRLDFDKYTVKVKGTIMSLVNLVDNSIDTLLEVKKADEPIVVKEPQDEVYIIKKDVFLSINHQKDTITSGEDKYKVTTVSQIGSVLVYTCSAGTLEISKTPRRHSRWNGTIISQIS